MNMINKLVSVIMPVYNDSIFLTDSINSVLSQSYSNLEIIIVDDNSSDNSIAIIESFNDKRIRLIKNDQNRGSAYCRNIALKAAKGDYIAFLDADDMWHKEKLEKQLNFMVENGYEFSYTNFIRMDEDGKLGNCYITGPSKVTHKAFIKSDYVGCLTVMYKRSIYLDLEIDNRIRKRNDYALWLLLSEKSDCYLLDENLSYYRLKKTGISKGFKGKLIKHHAQVFRLVLGFSTIHSYFCALRNVFYFFVRRLKYKRKIESSLNHQ